MPVRRVGPGKYPRRWVSAPSKIARGEKLLAMYDKEWEEAELNPVRYAHIQWKGKDETTDGQVVCRTKGRFFDEESVEKAAKKKLEGWGGKTPWAKEVSGPSPGYCLVAFHKTPLKNIKYNYDPKRTTRVGRYGFGYHTTIEVGK